MSGIDEYGFKKNWIKPSAQADIYRRIFQKRSLSENENEFILSHTAADPRFCRRLVEAMGKHLSPRDKVLSVAEGQGHLIRALISKGLKDIQGVDVCAELVESGRAKGLNLKKAKAAHLPFEDDYFDALIINEAIGAIGLSDALVEARRVLKPGACLIITNYHYVEHKKREVSSSVVKYRYILPALIKKALKDKTFRRITSEDIPIYLPAKKKKMSLQKNDRMDMIIAWK